MDQMWGERESGVTDREHRSEKQNGGRKRKGIPTYSIWAIYLHKKVKKWGFSTSALLSRLTLCCGGEPVYCKMFGDIPGLHLIDTSSPSRNPKWTTTNVTRHRQTTVG